jgi:hypothetical protein
MSVRPWNTLRKPCVDGRSGVLTESAKEPPRPILPAGGIPFAGPGKRGFSEKEPVSSAARRPARADLLRRSPLSRPDRQSGSVCRSVD